MGLGEMFEVYIKGLITFFIIVILVTAISVWYITYSAVKNDDGGAAQKKYEETVNSLTEDQRKILGL